MKLFRGSSQIPFTIAHDLRRTIKDLSDVKSSIMLIKESAERRVRDDDNGCKHIRSDGYCGLWYWYQRRWDQEQMEDTVINDGRSIRVYRDNVKKNPLVCASCPSYGAKRTCILICCRSSPSARSPPKPQIIKIKSTKLRRRIGVYPP